MQWTEAKSGIEITFWKIVERHQISIVLRKPINASIYLAQKDAASNKCKTDFSHDRAQLINFNIHMFDT